MHYSIFINAKMKLPSLARASVTQPGKRVMVRQALSQSRFASSTTNKEPPTEAKAAETAKKQEKVEKLKKTHKTMAELDEEMKQAMEGMSGEGGEYGLELEGGKPVSMKRSVKENMFRYI